MTKILTQIKNRWTIMLDICYKILYSSKNQKREDLPKVEIRDTAF